MIVRNTTRNIMINKMRQYLDYRTYCLEQCLKDPLTFKVNGPGHISHTISRKDMYMYGHIVCDEKQNMTSNFKVKTQGL